LSFVILFHKESCRWDYPQHTLDGNIIKLVII